MHATSRDAAQDMAARRRHQVFPVLDPADMARMARYGEARHFHPGELLKRAGERCPGLFVLLAGRVVVKQRDGFGRQVPIVEHGPGEFMGELGQLEGTASFTDAQALDEVDALHIPAERLRALIISQADLGQRILRALILRRAMLIDSESSGPVLIGHPQSPQVLRLQGFLRRNALPYQKMAPDASDSTAALLEHYGATADDVTTICPNGAVLVNPDEAQLARCIGTLDARDRPDCADVLIIGAGPAGLATAVYAASEGLKVLVVDGRHFGGQAGASTRIENYLGFPTGISGLALAARAFVQAQKFGAEIMIPVAACTLDCSRSDADRVLRVQLGDGRWLRGRAVVVASGASYRRPAVPRLADLEGRGVWYWASAMEAALCEGAEVALVGGGNSAGQAAVYLADHAARVHMLVRGRDLSHSMSRYLVDRISDTPNIEVLPRTELCTVRGDRATGLLGASWRSAADQSLRDGDVRHLFLFIGAQPETRWLEGCGVATDANGFILTGADAATGRVPTPRALETSVPGVFAVGDVRAGSVKRIGGAIGEGAAVVALIHQHLRGRDRLPAGAAPPQGP
jgi:thioredoxin reductase (NADPH)